MLEHSDLLLLPWQDCPADPLPPAPGGREGGRFRRRDIVEPDSQRRVGFVCSCRSRFSWLTRPAWEIYEMPDASLLITLKRPWLLWRFWEVFEADQRRVGMIYRRHVLNWNGQRLALIQQAPGENHGRFVACGERESGERELAQFVRHPHGSLLLTFGTGLDPFTRMTILGAALGLG